MRRFSFYGIAASLADPRSKSLLVFAITLVVLTSCSTPLPEENPDDWAVYGGNRDNTH